MPARSVCRVTWYVWYGMVEVCEGAPLSLSEAGPVRFGRQASVADIYHAIPCHPRIIVRNRMGFDVVSCAIKNHTFVGG